jgi:membrane-associated HD superfamily phosphohydrolase
VVTSLRSSTNLRDDPFLSQRRIADLVSSQGLPTLNIQRGDLITRQGETITPQAFDVLDYFGLINRRPRPLVWFNRFAEALAACITMLLVMRRWRASLEPRQGLLALARAVGKPPGPAAATNPVACPGARHHGRTRLACGG